MAGDNWKSLDELFCDLIQDPLISSLINSVPESVSTASSPSEADSTLDNNSQTNTSWRPWSPMDDPHRTIVPSSRETPPTSPQTPPLSHPSLSSPGVFVRPNHSQAVDRPSSIPLSGLDYQPKLSPVTPTSPPQYSASSSVYQTQRSTMFPWPETFRRSYGSNYCPPDYSQIVDVEVVVNANIIDGQLYGKRGVVRRVSVQNIANVYIYDLYQEVKIPCSYLQQVIPSQNDFVKVISGVNKGCVGKLVSCANQSAIVQLQGPYKRNLYQFSINQLGKYIPKGLLARGGSAQSPTAHSPMSGGRHSLYPCTSPAYSNGIVRNGAYIQQQRYSPTPMRSTYSVMPMNPVLKDRVSSLLAYGKLSPQQVQQNAALATRSNMLELLEELMKKPSPNYDFSCLEEVGEVKASCVRVSLVCPLSQRRMRYPSRGTHCKHPQCFDAEAYIDFNRSQKLKGKIKNGMVFQPVADRRWKCPLCHKYTPFHHLYIDRTLLKAAKDTTVTEVEFDKSGSWKAVEKADAAKDNVIDLTLDDSDDDAGPS